MSPSRQFPHDIADESFRVTKQHERAIHVHRHAHPSRDIRQFNASGPRDMRLAKLGRVIGRADLQEYEIGIVEVSREPRRGDHELGTAGGALGAAEGRRRQEQRTHQAGDMSGRPSGAPEEHG